MASASSPGVEFNILDKTGRLDITDPAPLSCVRFGIASLHDVTMERTTRRDHTDAYVAALCHPHVHMVGHPGYSYFPHDPEPVVMEAKKRGKLIEINNSSFGFRSGSRDNCLAFARLAKQHDVRVCVSSDAHVAASVGSVGHALALLAEVDFPPELVLNRSMDDFFQFLASFQEPKHA